MTESDMTIRAANVALAKRIMADFGRDMRNWYDNLHDDMVMEFPFGASVGMPTRIEGKTACSSLFAATCAAVQVQFHDVRVHPMQDPNYLLVEYRGYSEPGGRVYDQTYICVQEYRDGKMILFREYWNSKIVDEVFGDLSALGV
jgi:ketosteroid isomerase-like protein